MQCKEKPKGDKYGFTHFARLLCSGKGLAPLASDSRRRSDRAALEWGDAGTAGAEKYALEEAQRAERRVGFYVGLRARAGVWCWRGDLCAEKVRGADRQNCFCKKMVSLGFSA